MKKNISFLNVIKNTILIIFTYLMIFSLSFCLVSFVYFDHKKESIQYQNIDVYREDDIENFNAYLENNSIFILINLKEKKSDEYLCDYAYHYFSIYKIGTYLEANNIDTIAYVNVNLSGQISLI